MNNTMACCVLHGKGDIRYQRLPIPSLLPHTVLIKMQRMGICGTDVGYFKRGPVGRFGQVRPFILGHEGAGEVVELGAEVQELAVGDRVAIDPSQPCHFCRYCMMGRYNLCQDVKYLGSANTLPKSDGLFADYLAFPARNCYRLPHNLEYGEAALIEPLSVAMHAVKRAGAIYGASVLVTGGGPIGQLMLLVARAFGAGKTALSEIVEARRRFAANNGTDKVFDPTEVSIMDDAIDFADGGFDCIFEASGSPVALRQAFEVVRPGGTIVQVGSLSGDVQLSLGRMVAKEVQFLGSFRFANVFQTAIDLVASGRMNLRPLITHTFPMSEFDKAMQLANAKQGVVKVQIEP